jgi:hypothetical protein
MAHFGDSFVDRLRRYETQAVWALGLALVSFGPACVAVFLALRNYNHQLGRIVYGGSGRFALLFAGSVIASAIIAFPGFVLGLSSAGKPRNDRSAVSWAGFFLGGLCLCGNIILLLAFYLLGLKLQ